jgi:Domain of unknown function (DUF4440)
MTRRSAFAMSLAFSVLAFAPVAHAQADSARRTSTAAARGGRSTDEALISNTRRLWELFAKKDVEGFKRLIAPPGIAVDATGINLHFDPQTMTQCEVANYELREFHTTRITSDVVVVSYAATQNGTCQGQAMPSKVYATDTWVRMQGRWLSKVHTEATAM